MLKRPIGKSGIEASALALGTWAIGGWLWGGTDEKNSIEAIQASIDCGVTLIDTAPAYGMGRSEEIIGKAIAGRRESIIIATKCGLVWDTDKGRYHLEQDGKKVYRYMQPDSIRKEVEMSLKRLRVDVIDLLQTHWQDDTVTATEDVMAGLLQLKKEGKIRAIGASNVEVQHIKDYCRAGQLDCIQNKYSMLDRCIETDILPYCQQDQIAVLAYSPLAMGLLSGKFSPNRNFKGDDVRKIRPRFLKENYDKLQPLLRNLQNFAIECGYTMSQLVIAWTKAQPGITHVLVGARNQEQAKENAKAGEIALSSTEIHFIDALINEYAHDFV